MVEIPEEIDGYQVTVIDSNVFRNNPNIKEVIIPEGVTTIGSNAFFMDEDYRFLTITIPESVTFIDGDIIHADLIVRHDAGGGLSMEAYDAVYDWISDHQSQIRLHERFPEDIPLPDDMDLYNSIDVIRFNCGGGLYTLDGEKIELSELGIEDTGVTEECNNITIRGYSGSYAETYAKEKGLRFESIGNASSVASVFSGGNFALAGIGGLALGIAGTLLVTQTKKKKND